MNYEDMLAYVKKTLEESGAIKPKNPLHNFRDRYEHSRRVFEWCKRIHTDLDCKEEILYTAAIFHDVGRAYGKEEHAQASARIFIEYAELHNLDMEFTMTVADLIARHSDKRQITDPKSSPELILLLEADLLDEEGALGIVWDLMALGAMGNVTYYDAEDALRHAKHILKQDYMITPLAKEIWERKKKLVWEFVNELEQDLFMEK
jgi:uncharacterized protein